MPEIKCLDSIPNAPDREGLIRSLRLDPASAEAFEVATLLEFLGPIARPRALYTVAFIDARDEESVTVDGVTYRSRVLARNLSGLYRVFPYIATCGPELDEAADPRSDDLARFWIDAIKTEALEAARSFIVRHIAEAYATGTLSSMNPGSGEVDIWPIEDQRLLFDYFGDTESTAGVRLTQSCLMVPNKTVSGILFPSETTFMTCTLCRRENCVGRRAAFDPDAVRAATVGANG